MPTLWQKLRLALKGWSRRAEENRARQQQDFLRREGGWGTAKETSAPAQQQSSPNTPSGAELDVEGLQIAFLDHSGAFRYYLDRTTGQVEQASVAEGTEPDLEGDRYALVPQRSAESEAQDRWLFAASVEKSSLRRRLEQALQEQDAAAAFREVLSADRALERRWYSFKNDRAYEAIREWLEQNG